MEVLIVGAGPAGLTLGNILDKLGVDYLIIDKHPDISFATKATGLHRHSLRLLKQMGLAEDILKESILLNSCNNEMSDELYDAIYNNIDNQNEFQNYAPKIIINFSDKDKISKILENQKNNFSIHHFVSKDKKEQKLYIIRPDLSYKAFDNLKQLSNLLQDNCF